MGEEKAATKILFYGSVYMQGREVRATTIIRCLTKVLDMLAIHSFRIHAECPLVAHKQWDYYTVNIQTEDIADVHFLETVMDSVRGIRATQEEIGQIIRQQLACEAMVEIVGRHGQNSKTKVLA
jgi:hypothetical protein